MVNYVSYLKVAVYHQKLAVFGIIRSFVIVFVIVTVFPISRFEVRTPSGAPSLTCCVTLL
jgi:hypothetical protein